MSPVSIDDLPVVARSAWLELREELRRILGDDLIAIWAYGGTTAVGDEPHAADLDTYVILARAPDAETALKIEGVQDAIARDRDVEWDAWYVLEADARRAEPPHHAFHDERRDTSWAIQRAHWLDGRYVALYGPSPGEIVTSPTWQQLASELDRELEHIERHVVEGDTDPFEATYAILNGCRILYAVETRNVAISKAAAGAWALDHLQAHWHPALQAARRAYIGQASAEDVDLLAAEMAPFVAFVRERLPARDGRAPDADPRWSGS
jgi:hypothetical protein